MKDKQNRLAGLKYELKKRKENHEKDVVKKLSDEQRDYVQNLGYKVVPWLYEITTKRIMRVGNWNSSLIRDVHYANGRGQKKIYRKLKSQDIKVLDEYNVKYCRFKDKIIL